MRTVSIVAALAAVSGVTAQAGIQSLLGGLSTSCQQTLLGLVTASNLSTCLNIPQIIPIVTPLLSNYSANASLVPALDQIVAIECGSPACSNSTLTSAINTISTGCATDLASYNITNSTLRSIVSLYPLAQEALCLKTSAPFNGTAPIPSNSSAYNTTNGTFCTTSLLTDVSSKFNSNISISFLTQVYQAYMMGNLSSYARYFNASDLCQDCIFGYADLIGVAYPTVGNITLGQLQRYFSGTLSNSTRNSTTPAPAYSNITIEQALDGTCMAQGLIYNNNGTLPSTIYPSAINSSFPYALRAGNTTYPAPSMFTPIRRSMKLVKGRWVGQI